MHNVIIWPRSQGPSPVELLRCHVAQIAGATCIRYAGSQHESVPYQTKRTGGASFR